jgi:AraC-like DNA-binding protein
VVAREPGADRDDSEDAFNRAFKRHAGEPPAAWRTSAKRAAPAERVPA